MVTRIVTLLLGLFFGLCSVLSFCGWLLVSVAAESAIHEIESLILLVSAGVFALAFITCLAVATMISAIKRHERTIELLEDIEAELTRQGKATR